MRTQLTLLFLLVTSVGAFGCGGSRLSDADVTHLCTLLVRCGGGSQTVCEADVRQQRDAAAAAGCAANFGAAGRCAIRADACGTDPSCADANQRLLTCAMTSTRDAGLPRDSGPRDDASLPATRSMIRLGAGGAIEILHEGRWGPICDDGFTITEANVACRHLGFSGAVSFSTITGAAADFWLDDVSCTGTEEFLDQCTHSEWGVHNCSATETQAVVCR